MGRAFTDADDQTGAEPVVVLSYGFWQRRFNGDAAIVGRSMRLDGTQRHGHRRDAARLRVSALLGKRSISGVRSPRRRSCDRTAATTYLREFGRLKPGVTPDQADAAMKAIDEADPQPRTRISISVKASASKASASSIPVMRRMSAFAFGLTFLVLLIACVNLANLQLARTAARAREFAIRGAIGGGKGRLLRQSLTDSLVLSIVGGAIAIPLSFWCTRLIASRQFADLPGVRITLEPATLAFAFVCAVLTGLIFGAVPAWLASRADINDVLKQNPQSMTAGRGPQRFRQGLIVAEIAFALIILAGAVSLVRGLQRITGVDPGWRADGVLAARLNLVGPNYAEPRGAPGVLRDAARSCRRDSRHDQRRCSRARAVPAGTIQLEHDVRRSRAARIRCWPTTSA